MRPLTQIVNEQVMKVTGGIHFDWDNSTFYAIMVYFARPVLLTRRIVIDAIEDIEVGLSGDLSNLKVEPAMLCAPQA